MALLFHQKPTHSNIPAIYWSFTTIGQGVFVFPMASPNTCDKDLHMGFSLPGGLLVCQKGIGEEKNSSVARLAQVGLLFAGALFSKGVAPAFPVLLLMLDCFGGRKKEMERIVAAKGAIFPPLPAFRPIGVQGKGCGESHNGLQRGLSPQRFRGCARCLCISTSGRRSKGQMPQNLAGNAKRFGSYGNGSS